MKLLLPNPFESISEFAWVMISRLVLAVGIGGPIQAWGADIRLRLDTIGVEPADIRIYRGDAVIWVADAGTAGSVDGFEAEFESPVLIGSSTNATFSRVYESPGFFAFRHLRRYTQPPYGEYASGVRSHGTIQVIERPVSGPKVALVAPVAGAIFGALPTNYPGATFPRLLLQAAVINTNEVAQMEFYANGMQIGASDSWPYELEWTANQFGTIALTATTVEASGTKATSMPVEILVEENTSAVLYAPRIVRPGFIVFD